MQTGKRDQKITIRQSPTAKSASGADIAQAPVDVATVWARITISPGGRLESMASDALSASTRFNIEFPYLSGLDETMEIYWHARDITLDIVHVPDLGPRPRYLTLIAEERR